MASTSTTVREARRGLRIRKKWKKTGMMSMRKKKSLQRMRRKMRRGCSLPGSRRQLERKISRARPKFSKASQQLLHRIKKCTSDRKMDS